MAPLSQLRDLEKDVRAQFVAKRQILSFDEYFELFWENPTQHCRTAAQYVRDCIEDFGEETVQRGGAPLSRYKIFDCSWEDGRSALVGQEEAQGEFVRVLNNFIRDGRVTRFVLLHGPNGSAKSSFISCLARGLEVYSHKDEGAVYRFNWVFPTKKAIRKPLGFSETEDDAPLDSYAHLDELDIDGRIPGDLNDHPLLLLPMDRRQGILQELRDSERLPRHEGLGDYLVRGDLSSRCRSIADALLNAYHGDVRRVLQHIQVERFFFSRRYRRGVVTVEPQMHVDAAIRQVTADQGLANLPPSLQNLSLYEPFGDLVDANRGIIEYNDLLKKPLDTYKYLLATCEKGTVALPNVILHLDALFLATSNELHLEAFKEYPDFPSFKGRMDLIKMPYFRDYKVEKGIYEQQVEQSELGDRLAPHSTFVLALWAVLTRLHKPDPERFPEGIREVIGRIGPAEKADLYAGEREPSGMTPEEARELRTSIHMVLEENQDGQGYEGSGGASPRVMKEVMLNALQNSDHAGLSPLSIIDELRHLVTLKSVYAFLQQPPIDGYHDNEAFIDEVFDRWLTRVDDEVRSSVGLVSEKQYVDLFGRYMQHVNYALKGERIYNEATGKTEDPDYKLMGELEKLWKVGEDAEAFRRDLRGRVGVWSVDYPGEEISYQRLFPDLFEALEDDYYQKQRANLRKLSTHMLQVLSEPDEDEPPTGTSQISKKERVAADKAIAHMETDFGYARWALKEALGALVSHRY